MRKGLVAWLVGMVVAVAIATTIFDTSILQTSVAVGVGAAVLRLGMVMIGGLAQPVPEPPDPGELRKVKLTYRCSICGAEVKMTVAASQDPEPPRHCLEDMQLLTPVE